MFFSNLKLILWIECFSVFFLQLSVFPFNGLCGVFFFFKFGLDFRGFLFVLLVFLQVYASLFKIDPTLSLQLTILLLQLCHIWPPLLLQLNIVLLQYFHLFLQSTLILSFYYTSLSFFIAKFLKHVLYFFIFQMNIIS